MKKIIISDRWDGFGERMLSLLNALYISKKFGYDCGFIWKELNEITNDSKNFVLVPKVPSANFIFDCEFLNSYLINDLNPSYDDFYWWSITGRDLKIELSKRIENNILYSFQGDLSNCFLNINKEEYFNSLRSEFYSIKFSSLIQTAICKANEISCRFGEYIAIHIRGGDIVYDTRLSYRFISKALSLHLAANLINLEKMKLPILIFGNDLKSNLKLKKTLLHKNIFVVDDFIPKRYNYSQRAFFEIILMSNSSFLYSTGASGFSNLACRIGKCETINILKDYEKSFLYDNLNYGLKNYKFNDMQTAFSYLSLYCYSCELKYSSLVKIKILKQGLHLYNDYFYIFSLFYVYVLLAHRKYSFANNFLLRLDIDLFCEELLINMHGCFYYQDMWPYYFNDLNNSNYDTILYLRLKILNIIIKNNIKNIYTDNVISFNSKKYIFLINNIDDYSFFDFLQFKNKLNFYHKILYYISNIRFKFLKNNIYNKIIIIKELFYKYIYISKQGQ